MADKNVLTYADFKDMKKEDFLKWAADYPEYKAWLKKAAKRTETRVAYPRKKVWDNEKGKDVYVADYSKEPRTHTSPISFFNLKKAFLEECLKVEKSPKAKKETFRDILANL